MRGERGERERIDGEHLGVELVGLGEDSLGPRVVEEAVVYERREPGSDAVGTSVGVGTHEHVDTCEEAPLVSYDANTVDRDDRGKELGENSDLDSPRS
jgi:hypothetical protein